VSRGATDTQDGSEGHVCTHLEPNFAENGAVLLLTNPIIILLFRTGGIVHPPHDLASDEIDIDTTTEIALPIARSTQRERRTQIMPVGGTSRIPFRIIRFPPHKPERFSTHPYSREAALHGLAVEWIERCEALRQTGLP
jgi:hypothetical protein